jgi:hypothetical protein
MEALKGLQAKGQAYLRCKKIHITIRPTYKTRGSVCPRSNIVPKVWEIEECGHWILNRQGTKHSNEKHVLF